MHPLYGALLVSSVPIRITRCDRTSVLLCAALVQNLAVPLTFIPLSVSLWNDIGDPIFDGVGLVGFKRRASAFLLA